MSKKKHRFEYRIALRPDGENQLDDVVVANVAMFRLERMDKKQWWAACYFDDASHDQRLNFWFWIEKGELRCSVTEPLPEGRRFTVEPGSMGPA